MHAFFLATALATWVPGPTPVLSEPPPEPPTAPPTAATPRSPVEAAARKEQERLSRSLPELLVGAPIDGITLELAGARPEEQQQLENLLSRYVGRPATTDLIASAERMLMDVPRYARARCSIDKQTNNTVVLQCSVVRARILREVTIEGLPASILESDLRKRIFLKAGEPLEDDDTGGKTRLARQRARIEDFLEREGYTGAQVKLLTPKAGQPGEYNVVVRIRGGAFVHVTRVELKRFGPLSQRQLLSSFANMCLSSEGLLDGIWLGNITSCFNRRRLQATVDRFTTELQQAGYPEGRVKVETRFIDPRGAADEACRITGEDALRYKNAGFKAPPQCVELVVDVDAGRHVTTRFHADRSNGESVMSAPDAFGGTVLWLRETFLEPLSRFFQTTAGQPTTMAADTKLVEQRLRDEVTFSKAGAFDEQEAAVTRDNLRAYLARRGRMTPSVTEEFELRGDEGVVDFTFAPSRVAAVRSVRFAGNDKVNDAAINKGVELAARPRSFSDSGFISFDELTDDEERLREFYASQGFPEAEIVASAAVNADGDIDVLFHIVEGERFSVSRVVFVGGEPALTPAILKVIAHCRGGAASHDEREATIGADCYGAALLPPELDADAERVQNVYASHGYPRVDARLETMFDAKGNVEVRVVVLPPNATNAEREDPQFHNVRQVRRGEVFLEGNFDTRRDVILREMGIEDATRGAPLQPVALAKGLTRLRRSGLFNGVDLQYVGLDDPQALDASDVVPLRISVSERPPFTVDGSVGASTQDLVSLRTEVRHRNIFGTMLDAGSVVDFGLFIGRFSQLQLQLRWPRILGSDVSLTFTPLGLTYRDQPAAVRLSTPSTLAGQKAGATWQLPDFRERLFTAGTSASFDWRLSDVNPLLDEKLTLGVAFELRGNWLNPAAPAIAPMSREAFQTVDGLLTLFEPEINPVAVASVTPRVAYANLDNVFDPRNGVTAEVFVKGATSQLLIPYSVIGAQVRGYKTLGDRLTLAGGVRTRTGVSQPVACVDDATQDCSWALMRTDLMRLGGERSVRGVGENQIGVVGPSYDQQLQPATELASEQAPVHAGLYAGVVNFEVRYTLVRQLFIGDLRPALFLDAGMSTNSFDVDLLPRSAGVYDSRFAYSVGAGLRYVMPVGPLSVDVAYSPGAPSPLAHAFLGYIF